MRLGLSLLAVGVMAGGARFLLTPQVICLVPFPGITPAQVRTVEKAVTDFYHLPVAVLPMQQLPASAICPVRKRHRAAVILDSLSARLPATLEAQTKILALTVADIEVESPPDKPHWGVFGLARRIGGDACIASTFRLGATRSDRLVKVCLHEVGHTLHLPHCSSGSVACLMHDGEGKVATVDREEVMLCDACSNKLCW